MKSWEQRKREWTILSEISAKTRSNKLTWRRVDEETVRCDVWGAPIASMRLTYMAFFFPNRLNVYTSAGSYSFNTWRLGFILRTIGVIPMLDAILEHLKSL